VLQNYSGLQHATHEDGRGGPGLAHYLEIAKRRAFYFLVPFVLIISVGTVLVAIQKPIFMAEGRILVESQEIPTELVRSTVADSANQRIQVIQQRIMTRDKLLGIVNKFDLFGAQRQWMSGTQILDLMKERTLLRQVELNMPAAGANRVIAFTLSFEHENPELAMRVANEFLTLILAEDARARTSQATETTRFLEGEVKRLDGELAATETKISELRRRPREPGQELPDQVQSRAKMLAELKADLILKASVYSDAHPAVQALRSRVAALERAVAKEASAAPAPKAPTVPVDSEIEALERQVASIDKSLEEANRKLTLARLGERMERDQQAERLRVIEQPTVPQKPVRPNRVKLLTMAFAMAGMAGMGLVFAVEAFDRSIRGTHELVGIIDSHLVVTIPYIATKKEMLRTKGKIVVLAAFLAAVLLAAIAGAIYLSPSVDLSPLLNRAWIDILTRLSK
jgi:uncharacterized protein involved in exopolysaccharide biosynthesis